MALKLPSRPVVLLNWNDAHSPNATDSFSASDLSRVHGSVPITTVGWVLQDDHEGVTIAGEYLGDDDFRGLTHVPRQMVVSMEPIKKSRKRNPSTQHSSFDLGLTVV